MSSIGIWGLWSLKAQFFFEFSSLAEHKLDTTLFECHICMPAPPWKSRNIFIHSWKLDMGDSCLNRANHESIFCWFIWPLPTCWWRSWWCHWKSDGLPQWCGWLVTSYVVFLVSSEFSVYFSVPTFWFAYHWIDFMPSFALCLLEKPQEIWNFYSGPHGSSVFWVQLHK